MVYHGDVAIGWAGAAICEFSACPALMSVALAVVAEYSADLPFMSHVALFTTSETHWRISVIG